MILLVGKGSECLITPYSLYSSIVFREERGRPAVLGKEGFTIKSQDASLGMEAPA